MNYSTNKVQVSYFVVLPQLNFLDYTNSWVFPDFGPFSWLFTDLSNFPDISRFSEIPEQC